MTDETPLPKPADSDAPGAEARSRAPSFDLAVAPGTFGQAWPLNAYLGSALQEHDLWTALLATIQANFADVLADLPSSPAGVVVATHPLIALAGAGAIGEPGSVHVPVGSGASPPSFAGLAADLSGESRLERWLQSLGALARPPGPLVMRGWTAPFQQVSMDFAGEPGGRARAVGGVLCVADAAKVGDGVYGPSVILDLSAREDGIVAGAVHRLATEYGRLPAAMRVDTLERSRILIESLLAEPGMQIGDILHFLNTTEFEWFQRKAWRLRADRTPRTSKLFDSWVMRDDEDAPRHAASLFLASHFGGLTPEQFIALGDGLAAEAPSRVHGEGQPRAPGRITDRVLRDCEISFGAIQGGGIVSMLGIGTASRSPTTSYDEVINAEENLRDIFDRDAPLLRERFLSALALRLTLGHPSDGLVNRYVELELPRLAAAAAVEPAALFERMRKIVFGAPAMLRADHGSLAQDRIATAAALERSVQRAPQIVGRVAAITAAVSLPKLVGALTSAQPADPDGFWVEFFDEATTRLFWSLYADDPSRLTLRGLDCLFERDPAPSDIRRRRTRALDQLDRVLADERALAPIEMLKPRYREPLLLANLLGDIGHAFDGLADAGTMPFRVRLLMSVVQGYLSSALRGSAWGTVPFWPAAEPAGSRDLDLAKALLSPEASIWLVDPMLRFEDGEADVEHAARRSWQLARLAADGLLGSAAFGEHEEVALNIGLLDYLSQPHEVPDHRRFDGRERWLSLVRSRSRGQTDGSFGELVDDLNSLIPVFVLMAATRHRSGDGAGPISFTLSDPLKEWLVGGERKPAQTLRKTLDRARTRQEDWIKVHRGFRFNVNNLPEIQASYRDRVAALRAFAETIAPLDRESRLRKVAEPSKPAQPPSATSPAAAETPRTPAPRAGEVPSPSSDAPKDAP